MTRGRRAIIVLVVSGFIALAAQVVTVNMRDTSLLQALGQVGMSNQDGEKVVEVRPANCERGGVDAEPMLLTADISVRGVFAAWIDLVGKAEDQLQPVGLDKSTLVAEGYLEFANDAQGVFINVDPGESGVLRVGVATEGGSVVRTRLRTLRRPSEEPVAIFISGSTVEWWSREVRGRINNARPLGCTTLTIGAVNGISAAPGSVSAHLEIGDNAVVSRKQVNDYFRRFSSRNSLSVVSLMAQATFVTTLAIIGWHRFRRVRHRSAPL